MTNTERFDGDRLAENLLKRDRSAEANLPEVLNGLPVYKWEDFISEVTKNQEALESVFSVLGAGQNGVVLRMKLGEKDWCIKLYNHVAFGSNGREVLRNLAKPEDYLKARLEAVFSDSKEDADIFKDLPLSQAAAGVLGHAVVPDWVEAPVGLISVGGKIAATITPCIEGEATSELSSSGEEETKLVGALVKLIRVGVIWDNRLESSNMIRKSDGSRRFVDLTLSEPEVLNRDPRFLRKGDYFRKVYSGESVVGPFDHWGNSFEGSEVTIPEAEEILSKVAESHRLAKEEKYMGSIEKIVGGEMVISDPDEEMKVLAKLKRIRQIGEWMRVMGDRDASGMSLCFSGRDGQVAVKWTDGDTQNKLVMKCDEEGVDTENIRYERFNIYKNDSLLVFTKRGTEHESTLSCYDGNSDKELTWKVGKDEGWREKAEEWGWDEAAEMNEIGRGLFAKGKFD